MPMQWEKQVRSLDSLRRVRRIFVSLRRAYLRNLWGMRIHPTVEMSLSAKFDLNNPSGIEIGPYSYVAFEARILSHDMTRNIQKQTRIGANCFIGGRSLILPGVEIGDSCIVGAGSVVTKSVPPNCIVAGNPARIIRRDVKLLSYGRLPPEDAG